VYWCAPGADVYAPGRCIVSCNRGGGYAYRSGTSEASAMVAGVAALLKSQFPMMKGPALKRALTMPRLQVPRKLHLAVEGSADLEAWDALNAVDAPAQMFYRLKIQ